MREKFVAEAIIVNMPDDPEELQNILARAHAKAIKHQISLLTTEEEQDAVLNGMLDYILMRKKRNMKLDYSQKSRHNN